MIWPMEDKCGMQIKWEKEATLTAQIKQIIILCREGEGLLYLNSLSPFCQTEICVDTEQLIAAEGVIYRVRVLEVKKGEDAGFLEHMFRKVGKQLESDALLMIGTQEGGLAQAEALAEAAARGLMAGACRFQKEALKELQGKSIFQNRENLIDERKDFTVTVISDYNVMAAVLNGWTAGHCMNLSRAISNLPNNFFHTADMAAYCKELAETYELSFVHLGDDALAKKGAGGILSVNAGSSREAALLALTYKGSGNGKPIALVGKGILFDAGGYHLKSIDGMEGMKYDMCGAGNVLGILETAARQKWEQSIVAILPLAENVISPDAVKMGDVITTMAGKSVEVYNTDAEGRLILCDAITYAGEFAPAGIITLATLTYSCQAALGSEMSGVFCNNEVWADGFQSCAKETGDLVWRLPLHEIYHKQLKNSKTADLMNYAPGYAAGASVAACFLEEFVEEGVPFLHLDVVGTAVNRKETDEMEEGASGVMMAAISKFIKMQVHE